MRIAEDFVVTAEIPHCHVCYIRIPNEYELLVRQPGHSLILPTEDEKPGCVQHR